MTAILQPLASLPLVLGLSWSLVAGQEVSNLQPVVTICDTAGSFTGAAKCSDASRCRSFLPTGDLRVDIRADTCYWGSRFNPMLGDHFALQLMCPHDVTAQKEGGWCATLVMEDSKDACEANWIGKTEEERRSQYKSAITSTSTLTVVCNQCQYRAGLGKGTEYWMLQCIEPPTNTPANGQTPPPIGAVTGTNQAKLLTKCLPGCEKCQNAQWISSTPVQGSTDFSACASMQGPAGSPDSFGTLLESTKTCEWAAAFVYLPQNRPWESTDWTGLCGDDFNRTTDVVGLGFMADGGCIPLPGYSTLDVGPTISVQCKPYDVKPIWLDPYLGQTSNDATPQEKGSLGIVIILLIVAGVAIALVTFFVVKSQRRVRQMEAERSAYLQMHDTHASKQDSELSRAQQSPPRSLPQLRDPPAVEPRGYDFLPSRGDDDEMGPMVGHRGANLA